ncbi:hypothetical protein DPMN_042370 [Dreissena polymorpha]|uniref:Uncharacterized protein n=2 Tax=Dreissena polymorpha TaxID=45954 RepID=A0A9D4CYZ0_DREPO|nr:hypothetical protein DPMN_042370 [Dreissena polymorpha]
MKAHIVEVSGPILPSHCQHLVALYHTSQAADFGMVFNNHDLTTPFNILPRVVNLGALLSARIGTEGSSPEVKEAKGESQETTTEGFHSEEEKWVCGGNDIGNSSPAGKNDVLCAKIDNVEGKATDLLNAYESDSLSSKLFRHVPISDRVTAMKELVCTPTGFSWKS